jgi:hypothetical protein
MAQLDVGYVTVCCQSIKAFSGVAWPDLGSWGCYNMVSKIQFSTLSLDGPSKFELKRNFTED